MPQILQNYSSKSTKGLSRILVTLNLSGDILKLIYFLIKVCFYVKKEPIVPVRAMWDNSSNFRQFCSRSNRLLQKLRGRKIYQIKPLFGD